jgi:hypothetical protein
MVESSEAKGVLSALDAMDGNASGEQPVNDRPEPTAEQGQEQPTLTSAEAALLEAMRKIARSAVYPEPAKPPIGFWEVFNLLALALDAALVYLLLQEWVENPVISLVVKVVPWLLGATAATYLSDHFRKLIVALDGRKWVGFLAVFVGLPLLLARQPIFSMLVPVEADTVRIEAAKSEKTKIFWASRKYFRIVAPDLLKHYRVIVTDPSSDNPACSAATIDPEAKVEAPITQQPTMGFSCAYTVLLRRSELIRATLAETPLIGQLFSIDEAEINPRHEVRIKIGESQAAPVDGSGSPAEQAGTAAVNIAIAGPFEAGYAAFLDNGFDPWCHADRKHASPQRILCTIPASSPTALYLPPGTYNFSVDGSDCQPVSADIPRNVETPVVLQENCRS